MFQKRIRLERFFKIIKCDFLILQIKKEKINNLMLGHEKC